MNRQNNVPFIPSATLKGAAPVYKQQPGRVPRDFREAMKHISVRPADSMRQAADMAAVTTPAQKCAETYKLRDDMGQWDATKLSTQAQYSDIAVLDYPSLKSSASKWKSSFKPIGDPDDNSLDKSVTGPERAELYDPYDPASSDSEHEIQQARDHRTSPPDLNDILGHQGLSTNRGCPKKCRWDSSSEPGSQPLDRHDFSPNTRLAESRGHSPDHRLQERQVYSPDTESVAPPGYVSIGRPLEHRVCSPDRLIFGSSTQRLPASYGAQRTNGEERITIPEYRGEMNTTDRLSPHRLQQDYQHQLGYVDTGLDEVMPSTEVTRNRSKSIILNTSPITCDLCDVELANGQELQDHLESKSHWDTLEHIQQENHYDDVAIAFLQEAMLYKSHQCSRAIEDSVLQALQENDHMTKIEIFHCAACDLFLSSSASSVQTHITSQEHLSNTKEFEVKQRRACLNKAETMMKELKPQFEHFLKGGGPFE